MATPTNTEPNASFPATLIGVDERSTTVIATIVTEPPSHIGVPAQYRRDVNEPAHRPNAVRTHTYAPPSSGSAAPSSALASADGMKNVTNKTTSHVNACARPIAIAPIVSTTTMADIRNRMVSSRPSSRRSLDFSEGRPMSPSSLTDTRVSSTRAGSATRCQRR